MKDLVRMRTSLKEEIEVVLNEQVKMEAEASSKYLAIASWCERNGYLKSAGYFYTQSDEERGHMMKIFKYINEVGGTAMTPEVLEPKQEYGSLRDCFETALQSEINVTKSINRIVGACRKADDYATEQMMLWFVNEQVEEEATARRAVEVLDLMEGETAYNIDKELGKVRSITV